MSSDRELSVRNDESCCDRGPASAPPPEQWHDMLCPVGKGRRHAAVGAECSAPPPCWRCGDQPEDHITGEGCEGYVAGDPAFSVTRPYEPESGR